MLSKVALSVKVNCFLCINLFLIKVPPDEVFLPSAGRSIFLFVLSGEGLFDGLGIDGDLDFNRMLGREPDEIAG